MAIALLGTLAWLWLVRWRTGYHRAAIGKALRDGEPVPADVLGAYKGLAAAAPEPGYVRRTPRPGTAARTSLEEGADQARQAYESARTEKTEYVAKRGRSEAKLKALAEGAKLASQRYA